MTPVSLRIRPGGPAVQVAAVAVLGLWGIQLIVLLFMIYLLASEGASGWAQALPVMPLLVLATGFLLRPTLRVASGFAIDPAGIRRAARHRSPLPWTEIAGLRWGRTPGWGRHHHQLVADLRAGTTVVVWGVRSAIQHDRITRGLIEATEKGLIPPAVARGNTLYRAFSVVAADLDWTRALSQR